MKKIAFLLVVCLMIGCFSVIAFAADVPETVPSAEIGEKKTPRTDEEKAEAAAKREEREAVGEIRSAIKVERREVSKLVKQNKKARAVCRKAMNLYNKGEGEITDAEAEEIRGLINEVKEAYASASYDKEAFRTLTAAARADVKAGNYASAAEKYSEIKSVLEARHAASSAAGEKLLGIVAIVDAHRTATAE